MQVDISLKNGSQITIEGADRVFKRDEDSLYVYDQRNSVLAIIEKNQVVRQTQCATTGSA